MEGGIDSREALINKKTKRASDLDSLRSEVKSLESKMHSVSERKSKRASIAHAMPTESAHRLEMRRKASELAVSLPWCALGADANHTVDPYSYVDALKKKHKKNRTLPDPMAEQEKIKQLELEGDLPPLPMVADCVFRDGMQSVLIGEGWSADQALAALVSTQQVGTLAAAKRWLQGTLVAGNMLTGVSPKKRTTQSALEKLVQEETVLRGGEGSNTSDFKDPPLPPVRPSWTMKNTTVSSSVGGSPVASASSILTMEQHRTKSQWMSQSREGDNTAMTSSSSSAQVSFSKDQNYNNSTTMQLASRVLDMSSSSNNDTNTAFLPSIRDASITTFRDDKQEQLRKASERNIRIRIRRPTDGAKIELRASFGLEDLLSKVVMTFLEEQGEDATNGASKVGAEAAASFARMISASASKWCLVSSAPPKKAYTWKEMDRTTLRDAGVSGPGVLFTMQRK